MARHPGRIYAVSLLAVFALLPLVAVGLRAAAVLPFLMMPGVILVPAMVMRAVGDGDDPPAAADDDDSDGGGGPPGPPRRPRPEPAGPRGALPLPHSVPGSWRLRGQETHVRQPLSPRRQPARTPTPRRTPARHGRA